MTFDNIFRYYVSHHALGHCFLLFDTKGLYFDKTTLGLQYDSELHELVNGISKSSLEKFEFKLIRKINHFKKNENNRWAACQYFFYDINDGGDETYNVLKDELAFFDINPHYIIFDARNSKWLQNSIKSLSNTISSDGFDEYSNYKADHLIDINADDWKEDRKVVDTAYHIIFISDLIDSGTTFKRSYKSIQKKFPNSSVKCLSVLITEKAFKNNGGIEDGRTISIEGINVRYIKKVKQTIMRRTANRNECVLCRYNLLPPVETSEPIGRELSSFEMWMMSEEAGYKIEDYPPRSGRKKIIIPDSLEIFRRNAALVALKFQKRIEDLQIISNEYVIVFPDERNNENNIRDIEDTPSGYFAKCLKFYNDNYNYLPVPREFIRLLDESNELFEEVSCKFSTTIHQIESIDDGVPIIIIDEINVTGRTFKTIVDILGCCGKRATCYFPIFDFNKSGMDKLIHEDRYSDIKYTNLYQLDLNYE